MKINKSLKSPIESLILLASAAMSGWDEAQRAKPSWVTTNTTGPTLGGPARFA